MNTETLRLTQYSIPVLYASSICFKKFCKCKMCHPITQNFPPLINYSGIMFSYGSDLKFSIITSGFSFLMLGCTYVGVYIAGR